MANDGMERYVCIHGHFYQPPRENPWLEAIELQDSAYPYHDWNERITFECYAPNAAARILDDTGRISQIVNNYGKLSFNFGPTLLAWMQHAVPDVYQKVLDADRDSQTYFSGHGSALAQAFNHVILPLANPRDKHTQVYWGIRDFEHRFGRKPEGMWLPEAAANTETLEVLAAADIKFTVLSPYQAKRVRAIGSRVWQNVDGGRVDPTMPYLANLPSGRTIALFFYDGPISRAIAFEQLLDNGERFADRLLSGFSEQRAWAQIMHVATDGETYGHHHRFGDMALAYAIHHLEAQPDVKLTNYGEFLERFPPTYEAEIVENTSWSCAHGVERWRSNCGCNSGGHPNWSQAWRAPLRAALDWLRDELNPQFERRGRELFLSPWEAREQYIDVVLDRDKTDQFLSTHCGRELQPAEKTTALKLLEMQRQLMLMYTSCGWFFDELSGIETVQVIQYAGRAVQLGQELFGDSIEERFVDLLEEAKSNIPEHRNGKRIYEKFVLPARVDLRKVGAHYGVSSLFEPYPPVAHVYCYTVERKAFNRQRSGHARIGFGRIKVTSQLTRESTNLSFGVLHFGDHNLNGGVREYTNQEAYQALIKEVSTAFARADLPEIIRLLDRHFGGITYSLRSLFRDEQRRILDPIIDSTMREAESENRVIFEHHAPLMHYLQDLGVPLPTVFIQAAEVVINSDLRRATRGDSPDVLTISGLLEDAKRWKVKVDTDGVCYSLKTVFDHLMERFLASPQDEAAFRRIESLSDLIQGHALPVDLWQVQNVYWDMRHSVYPGVSGRATKGDSAAKIWSQRFIALGDRFQFAPPE